MPTSRYDCGDDLCTAAGPSTTIGTLFSLSPFLATFAIVALVAAKKVFPKLSRVSAHDDGEDHYLPASAPLSLQQAHAEHGSKSVRRRVAAATFAATIGLAAVLGELILAEIADLVPARARDAALRAVVPTLLFVLVALIPFLEIQSVVAGAGFRFQRTARGRLPRVSWTLQLLIFGGWLFVFWSLGRAVPGSDESYIYARDARDNFDSTGVSIGTKLADEEKSLGWPGWSREALARACLERIGVIGIALMALLSGFASVSSPWHTFADNRGARRKPVTDADIARKQSGIDATSELLLTKRHRLRSLQRKLAVAAETSAAAGSKGMMGKLVGSFKGMGNSDAAEIKTLQLEISGLETMEANLSSSLSQLQTRQSAQARAGTAVGLLIDIPTYAFSLYCLYRVMATSLTSLRRLYNPGSSFSSSDPINRFLGLLAKHWDPKLDQIAWARQISFLLTGVILIASANSVVQTFRIFAKWTPGLLYQAQANLALLIGQISATYVISAALLLRSNLPKDVSSAVGDALQSALEPGFVDRWFEGWFLLASVATAVGIWIGRKIGGGGDWDDWDEYGGEEMGQKRS
ncbi:putative g protein-coupled receptor protein [Phaeoacremonium minimum UCRPA7]|uniref:Putative g protein-coupled receptor protein n=1 Tax=Phaeoacremonium minimum (strain UCR-PA7) TaxID=1286976 RepID=R8BQH9_PHAM7|nr:putative g protein-coupled receptor protein [Phaeoacremonium minimum UCRPA7]EOO01607.1 putative g protein-coupled receptor protein [Phaeoacremonium minimum UCRPA7]